MKAALIGLGQSGKSTILAAVSGKKIPPLGAVQIEETIMPVPDERIEWLSGLYKPQKKVYATIDCLDLPGFSFLDEHGRAAARRLINQVRTVDMLILVVRAFTDASIPAYKDKVDAVRDLRLLQAEIMLADLELVAGRIDKLQKQMNKPVKTQAQDKAELELQLKLQGALESEKPISTVIESESELELIRSFGFLTAKPIMVVINTDEKGFGGETAIKGVVDASVPVAAMCAKIENELAQLDEDSRRDFMAELGIKEPAVNKFVNSCYSALGLISFLTVGEDEVRAWPIRKGTIAHDAAGKVHSDIKRGFIRAETMAYADLRELGNEKAVKAAGKARLEGKTYVVQDGDIINFRFNV